MIIELINLILLGWAYYYLARLHKTGCKCALNPNYYFLSFYIILSIVLGTFGLFMKYVGDEAKGKFLPLMLGIALVYFILTIVFIVVTLKYLNKIEEENCKCADGSGKIILKILAYIRMLLFVIAILLIIYLIMFRKHLMTFKHITPLTNKGGKTKARQHLNRHI